jgi:23S rRNA A1618 N6-methylase RlmF
MQGMHGACRKKEANSAQQTKKQRVHNVQETKIREAQRAGKSKQRMVCRMQKKQIVTWHAQQIRKEECTEYRD